MTGPGLRAVVIAGHTGDAETARAGLASIDPGVRAAALGALERLGALDADTISAALGDAEAAVLRIRRGATQWLLVSNASGRPLAVTDANGVVSMRFSNSGDFSGVAWETYAETFAWVLDAGDGLKCGLKRAQPGSGPVHSADFFNTIGSKRSSDRFDRMTGSRS